MPRLELFDQRGHFFHRFDERRDRGQLRANVHLETTELDVFELNRGPRVQVEDRAEIHSKLILRLAGRDVFVSFSIHIWVHPHRRWGNHTELASNLIQITQLFLALDVKRINPLFERIDDFVTGLTNTGKSTMRRIATSLDHPKKLSSGNDVETGPLAGQQAQHREIGICLHRVGNLVIHSSHRQIETSEVV